MTDISKLCDIPKIPTFAQYLGAQGAAGRRVMLTPDQAIKVSDALDKTILLANAAEEYMAKVDGRVEEVNRFVAASKSRHFQASIMWICSMLLCAATVVKNWYF